MTTTTEHDLLENTWGAVSAAGTANVTVYVKGDTVALVHVGTSNPGSNNKVGIPISNDRLNPAVLSGLGGSDIVYVMLKSKPTGNDKVVVIA